MLGSLTQSFSRLCVRSVGAGPSSMRSTATANHGMLLRQPVSQGFSGMLQQQVRHRGTGQLAPKRVKYRKAHKGRVSLATGGSIKGTTLNEGTFGIRLLAPTRLSAKQLHSAETALKRKLKMIKGAQVFLRVFPDIPVCVKGNETRMGKGKGSFHHWGCRATVGRVIFEIGGPVDIRPEVAKEALRLASDKLPVPTEFITRESAPRLGLIVETSLPPGAASARGGMGIVKPSAEANPRSPASHSQAPQQEASAPINA